MHIDQHKPETKQACLVFLILIACYAYVHQEPGWNQDSRLDLLHAIVQHQTFQIDAYHLNTGDKSMYGGHFYSDKAPGIVFLAIPAFAVSAVILNAFDIPLDSSERWVASSWITTVGSVGVITALGGAAMFLLLCRFVDKKYALITTMVTFLGAAPFPNATMLFSHGAVIGLICIAFWAIADQKFISRMCGSPIRNFPADGEDRDKREPSLPWIRRYLLAGICCGLAISSEYPAALAAGGLLALSFLTSFNRGLVLSLGAIPALLLIPLYNSVCFGGPLSFGYHLLAFPEYQEMNNGLFGITFPPKLEAVYLLLVSPERGLFFWTPFFLLAFFGLKQVLGTRRPLAIVCCSAIVIHIAFISGYYMPSGGAALGPRHLAPIIPFLGILAAQGLQNFPCTGWLLGYCSLLLTGVCTVIDAMPLPNVDNPLMNLYLPKLLRGEFAPSIAAVFGLPRYVAGSLIASIIVAYVLIIPTISIKRARLSIRGTA